jgi:hypothetical protein
LADHHLSGLDHRLRDVRLALGSVNRLTGRFAAICSTFKSDTGTIPDAHSHGSACTKGNTLTYPDSHPDTVTDSSACASASSTYTPPPIAINRQPEHANEALRIAHIPSMDCRLQSVTFGRSIRDPAAKIASVVISYFTRRILPLFALHTAMTK